ncbi:protein FAR1-RELATED SEQUENCE 5-like isoform X1 [Ziziphus jujuba]|uniref:Protein FAR1-RELATED SEQUENCE n=1 Tax=Ziziphus jujuba TaxID=326968 RepID=A0ABM3I7Q5_ZIZJJ|nr:protein FAR1-RELATED SEQUENCE 5-like isoform X1 [Ziziphus jujuba]XP_048322382.2 protein FAR1-RELATED SEQUENCE 5-like isoform X1 [Ziziphus jujuba]
MIFASLVGVNNHSQTVLFACAFLSDERTESFIWLFELLKESMPTNNPKMIITDQDPAMTKAIAQSLSNTFHRYCSWHILEKFSTYLNAIIYRNFYKDFQQCIWESECLEEFERKWVTTIEKASLYDNDWLKSIFEIRSRWVPAYVNHIFSAGISSSQRAESFHAFFKKYVSKKNLLMDFILRFNRALAHQRHEELRADHINIKEKPILKLPLEMEKQMAGIYTRKIFLEFQDELWHSLLIMPQLVRENATHKMYMVESSSNEGVSRVREIAYDKVLNYASCTCKKFESEGIPCRHILAFLRLFGNIPLLNQYIMNRWTRVAKSQIISDKQSIEISGKCSSMLMWQAKLFQLASEVIDKAITNEEAIIVNDGLQSLLDKIKSVVSNMKSGCISEKGSNTHDSTLKDPCQVRVKGYEKIGQSHDKKNSPVLDNPSSQNEENHQQASEFESEADSFTSTGLHEKTKG